jgi:FG-GAP repeat
MKLPLNARSSLHLTIVLLVGILVFCWLLQPSIISSERLRGTLPRGLIDSKMEHKRIIHLASINADHRRTSIQNSFEFRDQSPRAENVFMAENLPYGLQVLCDRNGITLWPNDPAIPEEEKWKFSLVHTAPCTRPTHTRPETISYETKPGHTEWFINSEKGIEHGMNLASPPSSMNEPLKFNFKVSSNLRCEGGCENNLIFKDPQGIPTLRYEKLIAYDATGRIIPTALTWDDVNSIIAWQVDHQGFDYPIVIDPVIATFAQTLTPPSATIGSFGDAIAIVGDFMAVGAPSGSRVYLYEKILGTWTLFSRKNFLVSPAANGGAFGTQVLMPDLDTIIVSDPSFDAPTSTGGTNANQGAIFIFGRNTGGDNNWGLIRQFTLTEALLPNGKLADRLGTVMAMAGNTLAASAISDSDSYDTALKSIYLFEKDRGGLNHWGQVPGIRIHSTDFSSSSNYARSFSLVGSVLAVGSAGESYLEAPGMPTIQFQGAVYLYGKDQGGTDQWSLLPNGRRYAPDGAFGDFFGRSVSGSGDLIAVGADGVDLSQTQSGAGAVYLLARNQGGEDAWGFLPGRVTAADAAALDSFGIYVKMEGKILAVRASGDDVAGTNDAGSVYLYDCDQGGSDTFDAVSNGKFSVDNVANITKVKSPIFLSNGHLAFATTPSASANSSISIANLSVSMGNDGDIGKLTFARDGIATFVP